MVKKLVKGTYLNFRKNIGFSFLNVFGLAIGLAVSILGLLYVYTELSYDRFHENSNKIYRITVDGLLGSSEIKQTYTAAAYAQALYNDFPEIDKIARINTRDLEFTHKDQKFIEKDVFLVDSTFFDIFTIPVLQGKTSSLLNKPFCAVLTKSTAIKYFGNSNPINQIIREGTSNFKVVAIVDDLPKNSHFHFNIAVSLISYDGFYNYPRFQSNSFRTYVMLHNKNDKDKVESRLPVFVDKYLTNMFFMDGNKWDLHLQALTSIHLNSDLQGEFEVNGEKLYVYLFLSLSIFILIIACINYINLSTANAEKRCKEIGIKKVLGCSKQELIKQFLGESILTCYFSLLIALLFLEIILTFLPSLFGIELKMFYLSNIYFIPALVILGLTVGIISGIYPAIVLSAFQPLEIIKGKLNKLGRSNSFRNILVTFQFIISAILIIGTLVISTQLGYLLGKDIGFNKERVIVIKNANLIAESIPEIKHDISILPFAQEVSHSSRLPGNRLGNEIARVEGKNTDEVFSIDRLYADEELMDLLELKLSKGRYFSEEYGLDSLAVIINEEAEKTIGPKEIIGKRITLNGTQFQTIIGVVKNFHYEAKHQQIKPMAILNISSASRRGQYLSVRIISEDYVSIINELTRIWDNYQPPMPFEYIFLDNQYDSIYENEIFMKKLFGGFSLLAIFIACLGLIGLTTNVIQQRTKEIGVRRTFGSSKMNIALLLVKDIIKWVIVANLIAWPIAWYFFNNWLSNFYYSIDISLWYFLIAGMTSFLLAILSVGYLTIRVVNSNPINALKHV